MRQAGSTVAAAAALDVPGQRPGTDGRGPPPQSFCPSRSTDGRRYVPRFVPSGSRLGLSGSTAWRLQGVKGGWRPPCSGCVGPTASSSGAQRQWRSIGARSMLDARSFMISTLRSQVSFAAAIGPLRKPASASHVLSSSRHRAGAPEVQMHRRPLRVCCARIHFANRLRAGAGRRSRSGRRPGRVRWGRPLQGSGSTSESAAGSVRLRGCGC